MGIPRQRPSIGTAPRKALSTEGLPLLAGLAGASAIAAGAFLFVEASDAGDARDAAYGRYRSSSFPIDEGALQRARSQDDRRLGLTWAASGLMVAGTAGLAWFAWSTWLSPSGGPW